MRSKTEGGRPGSGAGCRAWAWRFAGAALVAACLMTSQLLADVREVRLAVKGAT